ncbi:MAG: HalOD1 output domain-containing protein [Haloplanus sp.]
MSMTGNGSTTAMTPPHRLEIDWDRREPVSFAVQTALAEVEGCSPMELDPLADYVDPDALEAFFGGPAAEVATRGLSFEYEGYTVHVDGAGHVRIS